MHRSGTSALTRLLEGLGLFAGLETDFHPPTAHDPDGHREHAAVWRANETALRSLGRSWDDPLPIDWSGLSASAAEQVRDAMRDAIAQLGDDRAWVAKDPRLCLTLPLWRQLIDPVVVHVHRHPLEVAQSLTARDGLPALAGIGLWEAYAREALVGMAGMNTIFVRYEDLIGNPVAAATRLAEDLSIMIHGFVPRDPVAAANFLDGNRRRHRAGPDASAAMLTVGQQALFDELERLAEGRISHGFVVPAPEVIGAHSTFLSTSLQQIAAQRRTMIGLQDRDRNVSSWNEALQSELDAAKAEVGAAHADLTELRQLLEPPPPPEGDRVVFTIIARNYESRARVLAESLARHHPDIAFATVLIDGDENDRSLTGIGEVLIPDDLGLPRSEWRSMAAIYTLMEFATALKPAALRMLATRSSLPTAAVYLDPDIEIFGNLDEVFAAALRTGICLTPHALLPYPRDGKTPDETVLRHAGIFNLGFVGVSHDSVEFLDWWHERLRTDCLVDLPNAMFTDQRWIDFAPSLFECEVLRDPGLNAAYWNLHERPLSRAQDGTVLAGGQPLRFFHYSGYDPRVPGRLSIHGGPSPRVEIEPGSILDELTQNYAEALDKHDAELTTVDQGSSSYRYDSCASGAQLSTLLRRAIRRRSQSAGVQLVVDPFDVAQVDAFNQWLGESVVGPPEAGINAWEHELYLMRTDLQAAFPDIEGAGAYDYRHWLRVDSSAQSIRHSIGAGPAPAEFSDPRHRSRDPLGWNVVGYLDGEWGVAEAGRRVNDALQFVGVPTASVAVIAAGMPRRSGRTEHATTLQFEHSIYCINADELPRIAHQLEPGGRRNGSRRIGLWFWEVDVFPEHLRSSFGLLDEVWVTSEFTRDAIQPHSPVPVRVVPVPIVAPPPTPFSRADLGLPSDPLFAFAFDFHSIVERKNPLGVIRAFREAFDPGEGPRLVLKSINGHAHPRSLAALRSEIGDRADIDLVDAQWPVSKMNALVQLADCVVSLHRSEGFGLNLAQAMAVGTPVIATGYSGNLAFMTPDTAQLVPYELVDVGPGMQPYPEHARWADPDLTAAAAAMRTVVEDAEQVGEMARRARAHVLTELAPQRAASVMRPWLFAGLGLLSDSESVVQ